MLDQSGGAENAGVENVAPNDGWKMWKWKKEGVECALDETYEASLATTSESSESPETVAAATDDCCEVCLAPREGFSLVPYGHAGFDSCALCVADIVSCCPVCRAAIHMVVRVFLLMTLCTHDVIVMILCRFCTAV